MDTLLGKYLSNGTASLLVRLAHANKACRRKSLLELTSLLPTGHLRPSPGSPTARPLQRVQKASRRPAGSQLWLSLAHWNYNKQDSRLWGGRTWNSPREPRNSMFTDEGIRCLIARQLIVEHLIEREHLHKESKSPWLHSAQNRTQKGTWASQETAATDTNSRSAGLRKGAGDGTCAHCRDRQAQHQENT